MVVWCHAVGVGVVDAASAAAHDSHLSGTEISVMMMMVMKMTMALLLVRLQ